jgi:uncharacterized membrane protein YjjB (DUF3815 family)
MVEDTIAAHTGDTRQSYGRRVALIVRRVARIVAVPALLLMFGGLLAYGVSSGLLLDRGGAGLPGPGVGSLTRLIGPGYILAGETAMSLGLLALALAPAITVFVILVDQLRSRRWKEAAVAASVVAIMALSAVLGKK